MNNTTTASSTSPPANISEFNIIAGLVFAQLYKAFPSSINIDRQAVAQAMGIEGEWNAHQLKSGRSFPAVLSDTLTWLVTEDFTRSRGSWSGEGVTLSLKGLAAMNAVPQGLSASVGSSLVMAAGGSGNWSNVGDLVGGVIGGFTKSMSGA